MLIDLKHDNWLKAPEELVFVSTELPLKLWSVAHFYTTVVNSICASRPPNGSVFVDKLKDMEPVKTSSAEV